MRRGPRWCAGSDSDDGLPANIVNARYAFPEGSRLSEECQDLFACIFTPNPARRISVEDVTAHPWFLEDLPIELQPARARARPRPRVEKKEREPTRGVGAGAQEEQEARAAELQRTLQSAEEIDELLQLA